jgi:orotidine-5'-phosphate decarboxylase
MTNDVTELQADQTIPSPAPTPEYPLRDKLIVALDVPTLSAAMGLVDQLHDLAGMFKVGKEICTAEGAPRVVGALKGRGCKVFLDLKYHDVPNTVGNAVREASGLGADMLTVHTQGGPEMLAAAMENRGLTKILGVTLLTSIDDKFTERMYSSKATALMLRLATLAYESNCDGIVCAAGDLVRVNHLNLLKVVPGIRPADKSVEIKKDDQKRVGTPEGALANGASYLVVGRPIIEAPSPRDAALAILESMHNAQATP